MRVSLALPGIKGPIIGPIIGAFLALSGIIGFIIGPIIGASTALAVIVRASLADWISDWLGIRLLLRASLWLAAGIIGASPALAGIMRASLLCEPWLLLSWMSLVRAGASLLCELLLSRASLERAGVSLERAGASLVRNSACEAWPVRSNTNDVPDPSKGVVSQSTSAWLGSLGRGVFRAWGTRLPARSKPPWFDSFCDAHSALRRARSKPLWFDSFCDANPALFESILGSRASNAPWFNSFCDAKLALIGPILRSGLSLLRAWRFGDRDRGRWRGFNSFCDANSARSVSLLRSRASFCDANMTILRSWSSLLRAVWLSDRGWLLDGFNDGTGSLGVSGEE